jgi:phage tail-like protein
MGFYSENLYNRFLAEQMRSMDINDDLKQFVELFAMTLDEFDENIQDFQDIWDIDLSPVKYLPYIAQMIGWQFGPNDSEQEQRNQLKLAIPFYKKKGLEESFRILCYSYGLLIDVIPLWSDDYAVFYPSTTDPPFDDDTPPLDRLHPDVDGTGTGTLYPTPHVGIEITGILGGSLEPDRFMYILDRIHDIRPAHVVMDWWRLFIEFVDFVDFYDEDENYLIFDVKDLFPLGCFWRGRGCFPTFYRDGTVPDRFGPGGFYPVRDYLVYPPPLPTDPYTPDPLVDLDPDDPANPMPANFPFGGVHVRNPDDACDSVLRSDFDWRCHLVRGSSEMDSSCPPATRRAHRRTTLPGWPLPGTVSMTLIRVSLMLRPLRGRSTPSQAAFRLLLCLEAC